MECLPHCKLWPHNFPISYGLESHKVFTISFIKKTVKNLLRDIIYPKKSFKFSVFVGLILAQSTSLINF